jgi:hypothetical protein
MNKVPTEHYRKHPSGIECIDITRHMGFSVGNAVKYLWRADNKGNAIQDLRKAAWYVLDELYRRTGDTFYLRCREDIENYKVSVEPLNGLKSANNKELVVKVNDHIVLVGLTQTEPNTTNKQNENNNFTDIPVTC